MTEMPMGDMSTQDMNNANDLFNKQSNQQDNQQGEKKQKSADEQMVSKGADMALQANGIPPPASTMIGEKVGEAYTKAKDSLDVGKKIESGLNTALGAADIFSNAAAPKAAQDGMQAASAATKNSAANLSSLAENPVKETLDSASQPTEKQAAQADEQQVATKSKSMKMGPG